MTDRKITHGDIDGLNCYIDLHLHLDGSLSVNTVRKLAKMQNICIPDDDGELKKLLTVSDGCRDLNEYLTKFDFPLTLLQTEDAISEAVFSLKEELKADGLIYAEIRFAPQLHLQKGLTQDDVVRAAIRGMEWSELESNLILCCMRGRDNEKENLETVDVAEKYYRHGVAALDIAGAEALYKTSEFEKIFDRARKKKLKFTIHAGEADGAESIYAALRFGASRIGHGVRAIESEQLVRELAKKKIPLELCPTSNLNTAIFSDIGEYPIRELMGAGVRVTVNTDNISVSGTTVKNEYKKLTDAFGFTVREFEKLQLNSADASFADRKTKSMLKSLIRWEIKNLPENRRKKNLKKS